jgi:hypothetical protein
MDKATEVTVRLHRLESDIKRWRIATGVVAIALVCIAALRKTIRQMSFEQRSFNL